MPFCSVGSLLCKFPQLDVRRGHSCCKCKNLIHVFCAVENPGAPADENLTCLSCLQKKPAAHEPNQFIPPGQEAESANGMTERNGTPQKRPNNLVDKECRGTPKEARQNINKNYVQQSTPPSKKNLTGMSTRSSPRLEAQRLKQRTRNKGGRKISPKATTTNTGSRTKRTPSSSVNLEGTTKRLKKSGQQKAFMLTSDKTKPDPMEMKRVAFDVDDGGYGAALLQHFGGLEKISGSLSDDTILFGTIIRKSKAKRSPICYDVQWEDSRLGVTPVDLSVLIPAIDLSSELKRRKSMMATALPSRTSKKGSIFSTIFGAKIRDALLQVEEGEEGDPADSDLEVMDDDSELGSKSNASMDSDSENFQLEEMQKYAMPTYAILDEQEEEPTHGKSDGFRWSSEASLRAPVQLSQRGRSRVKPDRVGCFATPLNSLLAFIPLKMFKSIAVYSNDYARNIMAASSSRNISGARWTHDITISEIMTFFGVLVHMVLRPTPGNSYTNCWSDQGWHPYMKHMPLRRFQQIRSVLHFNETGNGVAAKDALFKVRPLLNCLKITFPSYLDLGDNFVLDEASIASRSRYGGNVIFFNPTKPGGKYHFRLYLLCCSTTYACIRLRMHTRNDTDFGDGYYEDASVVVDEEQEDAKLPALARAARATATQEHRDTDDDDDDDDDASSTDKQLAENKVADSKESPPPKKKLVALVLDMCKSLAGSGSVVNMDNYYTSPEVAVALQKIDVFMRGTCRTNRLGFPEGVKFTNSEANKQGRGSIKQMVDSKNHLAAFGWVDGNPVHFLTSADGTATTFVKRRIGRETKAVKAPIAIRRYNQNMHAVDRHDQLRDTFSLCKRHNFKKYYQKIGLGLLDMALVNAWIHYKLANAEKCKTKCARYSFMNSLANALIKTDWTTFISSEFAKENETIFQSLVDGTPGATAAAEAGKDSEDENQNDMLVRNIDDGIGTQYTSCFPLSVTNFMGINRKKKKGLCCQVCAYEGRGQGKTRGVVICTRHRLWMCAVPHSKTFRLLDNQGREVQDFSWMAPEGMSCWYKAHTFYIKNEVFADTVPAVTEEEMEGLKNGKLMKFQAIKTGSALYKKKCLALGTPARGNKKKAKPDIPEARIVEEIGALSAEEEKNESSSDESSTGHDEIVKGLDPKKVSL